MDKNTKKGRSTKATCFESAKARGILHSHQFSKLDRKCSIPRMRRRFATWRPSWQHFEGILSQWLCWNRPRDIRHGACVDSPVQSKRKSWLVDAFNFRFNSLLPEVSTFVINFAIIIRPFLSGKCWKESSVSQNQDKTFFYQRCASKTAMKLG